ncbi:glycosyltransferase [Desulfobacter latus]|uniref:Glycosyltransferase n=1 Tax=Desulfobacter latus TaxID=2292 RepID=A0A850T939_9BACT|nr:glycosyltransferase [Desulfobacter latus]NWH06052.1 glycosyltransferase [Desulfobacter latus]
MIKGKTILCFASGYEAPPTSKHHVMHILAEHNRILWINYHASRAPTASSSDLLYMGKKLIEIIKGLKNPRKNLFVLTPLVIPLPSSSLARKLNRFLLITQIRLALKKLRKGPVQVWSFTPDIAYALGQFNEEKVVYYCVDDHAAFTGYDTEQVLKDEEDLCRKSDLVITTAMVLQEKKQGWNPNTVLVTHGVDFHHFNRAVTEDLPCPKELEGIPHPRLGFFGLIRDWVDVDLLWKVAQKRPDWHFVLIGDADSSIDLGKYKNRENMYFLGRKNYEDLPAFCRHLDMGLIPFKVNELTHAVNPIKLREYLSAGLPVISTPMPEVLRYKHLTHIVKNDLEFEQAVEKHLNNSEQDREKISTEMEKETWAHKIILIDKFLYGAEHR